MYTLRCTQALLKRLKLDDGPREPTTTVLGDWYADRFNVGRHQLIVATNERTLLTLLTPAKALPGLPQRLRDELGWLLRAFGIGAMAIAKELAAMETVRVDRTESRSVLASMNQLTFDACAAFDVPGRDIVDLDQLALRLSGTPCKRLGYSFPAERACALFEVPTPQRREAILSRIVLAAHQHGGSAIGQR